MSADDVYDILAAAVPFDGAAADDRALADYARNDFGNGERLRDRFGRDLIWIEGSGWYVWAGSHWRRDPEDSAAQRLAHLTAAAIGDEADALMAEARAELGELDPELPAMLDRPGRKTDPDEVTVWRKRLTAHFVWAVTSGNQARIVAMLEAALPYLTRPPGALDADPDLFCVANGTLELRRQGLRFRPHNRADLITRISPVAYDAQATAPKFRAFLARVQPGKDRSVFLQIFFGYGLTGETGEQVMAMLIGKGANGKSTLLNCVAGVQGDYSMHAPVESFLYQERGGGGDKASPDLARLPGSRLVLTSEPEIGARLSESRVKAVTGGERMTVRRLHKDFFEFDPAFKLVLSCNSKPTIRGSDDGIWRRILIVPFDVQIPEGERVKDIHKMLLAEEASGILNWLLDGWRLWREGGLVAPADVKAAAEEYRRDSDPIGEFLAAVTEVGHDHNGRAFEVQAAILYRCYAIWSKDSAADPISNTLFGLRMGDRGIRKTKKKSGAFYEGMMLNSDWIKRLENEKNPPPGDAPVPAVPDNCGV